MFTRCLIVVTLSPPPPPPPPSIVVINRRGIIYINKLGGTERCSNQALPERRFVVNLSKSIYRQFIKDDRRSWFFGSCGTVSGDGRNSGCSTLGNDGRVWERVSVMEVHQICDEKNGRDAVMIAGCAGDYFSTVLMSRLRQRYQQAIER